ncbi:MAG: helix-turn-helix domain-containing protein [Clostridia bacterium]|nr:helix-turn-helix domain-containing protein [Clostridia bacterium]
MIKPYNLEKEIRERGFIFRYRTELLTTFLEANDISVEQLCKTLNLNPNDIYKFLNQEAILLDILETLSEYLEIDMRAFYDYIPKPVKK